MFPWQYARDALALPMHWLGAMKQRTPNKDADVPSHRPVSAGTPGRRTRVQARYGGQPRRRAQKDTMEARIISLQVMSKDRTRVTINRGKEHGVTNDFTVRIAGMAYGLSAFATESVTIVSMPRDKVAANPIVTLHRGKIKRSDNPRACEPVSGMVIDYAVDGGRTRIIVDRGLRHGVDTGYRLTVGAETVWVDEVRPHECEAWIEQGPNELRANQQVTISPP